MPNTSHFKCLEYHIIVVNYLLQIVQLNKLNSPKIGKKKNNTSSIFPNDIPLMTVVA